MTTRNGNQYKATQIWNEIVDAFQTNIPLKRHRKNLRSYSNCFTATEAIDWLFEYLKANPNFKSNKTITRDQAAQLLNVFLRERIIEDVRGAKYSRRELEQDDERLFRLLSKDKHNLQPYKSPSTTATTTSTTIPPAPAPPPANEKTKNETLILKERQLNNQTNEYGTYPRISQKKQVLESTNNKDIWSSTAINLIKNTLNLTDESLFDKIKISCLHIKHNCTHINKHGVVINVNKSDDLPGWVLQAMTSLVHWTNTLEKEDIEDKQNLSSLKNPSFNDVYNEIRNYFNDLNGTEPLLTNELSNLFINILKIFIVNNRKVEIDEFMKNLKATRRQTMGSTSDFESKINRLTSIDDDSNDNDNVDQECDDVCCSKCLSTYNFVNNWLNSDALEFNDFVKNLNTSYRLENHENEPYSLVQEEEQENEIEKSIKITRTTSLLSEDDGYLIKKKLHRNNSFIAAISDTGSVSKCDLISMNSEDVSSSIKSSKINLFTKTQSMDHLNKILSNLKTSTTTTTTTSTNTNCQQKLLNSSSLHSIADQLQQTQTSCNKTHNTHSIMTSFSLKDLNSFELKNTSELSNYGFAEHVYKLILKVYQICLLFLPPINKRKLHLLLRLLYKLKYSEHTKYLCDSRTKNTEALIIDAFVKSIVYFDPKDATLANKLVKILLNNYSEIMKVPDDYVELVEESIISTNANYCTRITNEQYEKEKNESKQHIVKSLYAILTNMAIDQTEKVKRLKQFKEVHPDIYEEKYATIKKAINILGLNENDSALKTQLAKRKIITNSLSESTAITKPSSSNSEAINNLTMTSSSTTTGLNFPKFLIPKTFKKVRL